ncbi:esterase-like activity of phytase family protein [Ferruginivarius sediminum]|uniref:Esterase-like activity of phytase family protein n=1 Tax=Ferruginivarius sediminum TaxID=2661937 RepID=A0A369TEN4_9PROT|nr:esterase-like activity of phytase family protein [Ferruginivarius sediminum]RDD63034.1 esterase-like activity of phytase family protein [Ferruginivarius sediminum]
MNAMRLLRAAGTSLILVVFACTLAPHQATSRGPLDLRSTAVQLDPERPDVVRAGKLIWRGGLVLRADHADFGGLSGLVLSQDGMRMVAIGDKGSWVEAALTYDSAGKLSGVGDAIIDGYRDPAGKTVHTASDRDAEGLTRLADGSLLVAFEQRHRLWRYPAGPHPLAQPAEPVPAPDRLMEAPHNKGAEALARLADGRLLMLIEGLESGEHRLGFLRNQDGWTEVAYPREDGFQPTAAAQLPDGDLLVLERQFSILTGFRTRIRRIPLARIEPGSLLTGPVIAAFRPPLIADNFEGLAARRGPAGQTLVYVLSDDNFNGMQRNLLLMFALSD